MYFEDDLFLLLKTFFFFLTVSFVYDIYASGKYLCIFLLDRKKKSRSVRPSASRIIKKKR